MFMGDAMKIAGRISLLLPFAVFIFDSIILKDEKRSYIFKRIMCLSYVCVILYMTVLGRNRGTIHEINFQPLWSWMKLAQDDIRWQIYMNVFLFIPFGFILRWSIECQFWQIVLIGFLTSSAIELAQYIFCLGLCEIDDVIHNTIGAMIGYGYWHFLKNLLNKKRNRL